MTRCIACGSDIEDDKTYCQECVDYMDESYKQMESNAKFDEELRIDAFGKIGPY